MPRPLKLAHRAFLGTILGALPFTGESSADGRVYIQQAGPADVAAYVRQVDVQTPVRVVRAAPPAPAAARQAAPAPSRAISPAQAAEEVGILELTMPEEESGTFPDAHLDVK